MFYPRYGEETAPNPEREKRLFEKLQQKIQENIRKRQSQAGSDQAEPEPQPEVIPSPVTAEPSRNDEVSEPQQVEKPAKKVKVKRNKPKKRKLEALEAEITEQEEETPVVAEAEDVEMDMEAAQEPEVAPEPVDVQPKEFKILGTDKHEKRKSVKSVLPPWLAYPTLVSNNLAETDQPTITTLDFIDEHILKNLSNMGVKHLFPVQREVIPWLLDVHAKPTPFWPRDVCVSAPTGSGKTLAFAVPIVQLLLKRVERKVRALVILPVQELADQVASVFKKLCVNTKLRAHLLSSSFSFAAEQAQIIDVVNGKYLSNVDILITTAGRLVEHLNKTKGFSLRSLQFLVIDEADRVMDQIQSDWLYHLNKHVKTESDTFLLGRPIALCAHDMWTTPRPPHKLLFSATLSSDPEKLQNFNLFQPKLFTTVAVQPLAGSMPGTLEEDGEKRGNFVGKYTTPAELTERYILTEQNVKPLTLFTLIKENGWRKFLCFTNQADTAHRLAFVLQKLMGDEMKIEELSSSLTISSRKSVLHKFSVGEINGLISTDALARGIDIPKVDVVISYDMCKNMKSYIHRVGRTARAGHEGTAVTLVTDNNVKTFKRMLEDVGKTDCQAIVTSTDETYSLAFAEAIKSLQKALEFEKKNAQVTRGGTSNLLARLQQQVDSKLNKTEGNLPSAWQAEHVNGGSTEPKSAGSGGKKRKGKKKKAPAAK